MTSDLSEIIAERKSGNENFISENTAIDLSLKKFWQWSVSDILSNATRGILAEFIVASALGINTGVRTEWEEYDLKCENGLKIEIKSSGYLQSWHQTKLSYISFGIQPTYKWNSEIAKFSENKKRQSDIYVFCILSHKDPKTVNPLNIDQWEFYILPTQILNEKVPAQKTISLSSLLKLKPQISKYGELAEVINKISKL